MNRKCLQRKVLMAELETNKKLICKFKRLIDNDDGRRHGLLNRINIINELYPETATNGNILNYKRLCPSVCLSVSHTILYDRLTLSLVVRIKHLNAPSQCSDSELNI